MEGSLKKKKNYKWSLQRFSTNMLMLLVLITTAMVCSSLVAKAIQVKGFRTITIQAGDTLWKLAVDIAPNEDPRHTIAKIKNLNELNCSDLIIGQNLRLELTD